MIVFVCVAIKADGTVVTWGDSTRGGDSSSVSSDLVNVESVTFTSGAIAALKSDGSVVAWGILQGVELVLHDTSFFPL